MMENRIISGHIEMQVSGTKELPKRSRKGSLEMNTKATFEGEKRYEEL